MNSSLLFKPSNLVCDVRINTTAGHGKIDGIIESEEFAFICSLKRRTSEAELTLKKLFTILILAGENYSVYN